MSRKTGKGMANFETGTDGKASLDSITPELRPAKEGHGHIGRIVCNLCLEGANNNMRLVPAEGIMEAAGSRREIVTRLAEAALKHAPQHNK